MQFRKVLALRGPNVWASFPVLEVWVDLGDLKDTASSELPGFNDRLPAWLPSLVEHRCSVGERGGFFERLRRGTYLAHILEHVALELQALAGTDVGFGKTRQANEDGVYRVALEFEDEDLARACLETGRQLCLAAAQDRPFDVQGEIARLRELLGKSRPEPETAAVVQAARARKIPVRRLDASGLLQLGYGARQHRILKGLTDQTNAVANGIAYDRDLTRNLLYAVGVPVPDWRSVGDAADAESAAAAVGLPVVLRPRYAGGRGTVSAPLVTPEEVKAAYETAVKEGWSALVEKFTPGSEYRLLVIGERVLSVLHQGTAVTGPVHPDVAARAADAVRVVGLDMAEVEITAPDLDQPLEGRGAVTAVRGQPELRRHLETGRPIGEAIVGQLFPEGQTGRIPVIGVTGTNGKTTTTRLAAHLIARKHRPVGMACTEGVYVGDRRIVEGDCSGPWSARCVLQNAAVEAAVLETARGGILREGLGFDRCDVAIVTNIGEGDHLGASDIDTPEQLAWVKSTLVAAVAPTGTAVLNAADPLVVDMAKYCRGSVLWFARDGQHPLLVKHRAEQGRAIFVRDHHIILAAGDKETSLVSLDHVPLTRKGRIGFHIENALAAAAAAWSLGVPAADIRAGLETFTPSMDHVPARFNILDVQGITVVLDYGHNVSALARLIEALDLFPHKWRTIVYSAAGDRRDSDMVAQGQQLGQAFDRVILYEDTYLRGRKEGEISDLFRQGLAKGGRVSEIETVKGGLQAVEAALGASRPGDLLVIQPDLIDDAVAYLKRLVEAGAREISMDEALTMPAKATAAAASGVEVRSGRLGHSAYATQAFQRGDRLLRTWGPYASRRSRHSIQVDEDRHIIPSTPLRFFNHSCEPNCGLLLRCGVEELEVHALRPIAPGEELTLDYDTFESEVEFIAGPCLCNAASCRGAVRGYKYMPPKQRAAYGVYVAEYLRLADEPVVAEAPAAPLTPALEALPSGS